MLSPFKIAMLAAAMTVCEGIARGASSVRWTINDDVIKLYANDGTERQILSSTLPDDIRAKIKTLANGRTDFTTDSDDVPAGVSAQNQVSGSSAGHNQHCGVAWRSTWWGGYPYYQKCSNGLSCTGYSQGICLHDPRAAGERCGSDWASTTGCASGLFCDSAQSWYATSSGVCRAYLETRTWVQTQTARTHSPRELPEFHQSSRVHAHVAEPARRTVGLAISGGGARSYAAALGYIRGLAEESSGGSGASSGTLLDHVTYVSGTSGGGWFTTILAYFDQATPRADPRYPQLHAAALASALGPYTRPTDHAAQATTAGGAYGADFADGQFGKACSTPVFRSLGNILSNDLADVWRETVAAAYLAPFGLNNAAARYTWDQATQASAAARNGGSGGGFGTGAWYYADHAGPFPIVTGVQVGPREYAPFAEFDLVLNEFTPLYSGSPGWRKVRYTRADNQATEEIAVGGYVEPFAFGSEAVATDRDDIRFNDTGLLVGAAKIVPRENADGAERGVMVPLSTVFGITSNWGNKWTGCQQSDYTCLVSSALNGAFRELVPSLVYWSPLTIARAVQQGVISSGATAWSIFSKFWLRRNLRATTNAERGRKLVSTNALDVSNAADPRNGRRTFFDDSGAVDYWAILPLLVRHTDNIVVFLNSAYNNGHDPADRYSPVGSAAPIDASGDNALNVDGWDDSLRAYFGWGMPGREQVTGHWQHSHVFPRAALCSAFADGTTALTTATDANGQRYVSNRQGCTSGLAAELWKLKRAGRPLVHTMQLEVVGNDFYGIAPTSATGYRPTVTFVVLARSQQQTDLLPAALKSQLSPTFRHSTTDAGDKISNFPHFKSDAQNSYVPNTGNQIPEISLSPLQTRMLSDYTTWTVKSEVSKFRAAFGR